MMRNVRRNETVSSRQSFSKDTAKKLNLSERTIEREIQLSQDIEPETKANIFKGNQFVEVEKIIFPTFTEDTSKKLGLTPRTINQEMQLSRDIEPKVQEFIKEKGIGKSEALLIARVKNYLSRERKREMREMVSSVNYPGTV